MKKVDDKILKKDMLPLKQMIEEQEGFSLQYIPQMNGFWIVSEEYESELRVLFSLNGDKVIISRVAFHKKRVGTMTKTLNFLMHYGINNGYKQIVIQSVSSDEMISFCNRNGFQQELNTSVGLFGDYIKEI